MADIPPSDMPPPADQPPSNRADRLKPYCWQPGQSGNPKGRPPKAERVRLIIEEVISDGDWEAITRALVAKARKGDVKAATLLYKRQLGRAHQSVTLDTGSVPLVLELVTDSTPPPQEPEHPA